MAAASRNTGVTSHAKLGQALRERGQLDEAKTSYERALAYAPRYAAGGSRSYQAVIRNSLGLVLTREGKWAEALDHFAAATLLDPRFAEANSNLGNALAAGGRLAEAIAHYEEAIRLKPGYIEPRVGLGSALLSQGNAAAAIPHYREALRIDPKLAQAHNGRASHRRPRRPRHGRAKEAPPKPIFPPRIPTSRLLKKGDVAQAPRHPNKPRRSIRSYRAAGSGAITPKACTTDETYCGAKALARTFRPGRVPTSTMTFFAFPGVGRRSRLRRKDIGVTLEDVLDSRNADDEITLAAGELREIVQDHVPLRILESTALNGDGPELRTRQGEPGLDLRGVLAALFIARFEVERDDGAAGAGPLGEVAIRPRQRFEQHRADVRSRDESLHAAVDFVGALTVRNHGHRRLAEFHK